MSCMPLPRIMDKLQQNCNKRRSCCHCDMSTPDPSIYNVKGKCLLLELRNTLKETNVCITPQDKILGK